jgi:hypothetical protein
MIVEPVPKLSWRVHESGAILKRALRVRESGASSKASMEGA